MSLGLNGGAEGDRTPDLMTASHALSQLSYGPKKLSAWKSASDVRAMIEEDRSEFKRGSCRNPAVSEGSGARRHSQASAKTFLPQKMIGRRSATEDH